MLDIINRIRADYHAMKTGRELQSLFNESQNPEELRDALAEGDLETAREMTGLSEEEFHARIASIRGRSEALAKEFPQVAELNPDDIDVNEING